MMGKPSKTSSPSTNHVFQSSYWRAIAPIAVIMFLFSLIVVYLTKNPYLTFPAYLMALTVGEGIAASIIGFSVWYYRIDLDAAGIGGYNVMNEYGRIPWNDIVKVKPFSWIPSITYLRLYSRKSNHVIWVPLALKDMAGFHACVRQYADINNPMRVYLEQHFKNKAL